MFGIVYRHVLSHKVVFGDSMSLAKTKEEVTCIDSIRKRFFLMKELRCGNGV